MSIVNKPDSKRFEPMGIQFLIRRFPGVLSLQNYTEIRGLKITELYYYQHNRVHIKSAFPRASNGKKAYLRGIKMLFKRKCLKEKR